jgi:hypothetical protein
MADNMSNITKVEDLAGAIKDLEERKISVAKNMDDMFLIIMGIIIYCKLLYFIHLFGSLNL